MPYNTAKVLNLNVAEEDDKTAAIQLHQLLAENHLRRSFRFASALSESAYTASIRDASKV